MSHQLKEDEVSLIKSANVSLGNGEYMFVIYYYRSDKKDRGNSLYKCSIRIDSRENWNRMANGLLESNPAETYRNSMIGIDDDYGLFYSRRSFLRADMCRWIGSKFSKAKVMSMDDFLEEEFSPNVVEQFPREFAIGGKTVDISDVGRIPRGQWFSTIKARKPRKKYGNVIQ